MLLFKSFVKTIQFKINSTAIEWWRKQIVNIRALSAYTPIKGEV